MPTQVHVNLPIKRVERGRADVDTLAASGTAAPRASQDNRFMYGHGFEDPAGHIWQLMHMDPNAVPPPA